MSTKKDSELVERIRRGDKLAFQAFYLGHERRLQGLAYSYVHGHDLAEEIVQEAFRAFLRVIASGGQIAKPLAYLVHTVRNEAIRLKRRVRTVRASLEAWHLEPVISTLPGPEEAAIVQEERENLWFEMDRLPQNQREIIFLHIFNEMTFEDIHESLQIPLGMVYSRYRTALDALYNALGEG